MPECGIEQGLYASCLLDSSAICFQRRVCKKSHVGGRDRFLPDNSHGKQGLWATSQHTRSRSMSISEALSAAVLRALWSMSIPVTLAAPRAAAAIPSIPVPHPRSSTLWPSISPYSNSAVYTIRAARWAEVLRMGCDETTRRSGYRKSTSDAAYKCWQGYGTLGGSSNTLAMICEHADCR